MTERDYAIRSFKEVTLNAARHTEERMNLYYGKIKELMNNYQDLILENQMVLDELEQECQEKINENMAWAFDYDKMFCVLMENEICRKVCEKNKYNSWMNLIGQYCVSRT